MWLLLLTFPTKNDMLKHIVDVKMKGKGMRMYQVSKRDGQIAPFNLSKISVAIRKRLKRKIKNTIRILLTCWLLKLQQILLQKLKIH